MEGGGGHQVGRPRLPQGVGQHQVQRRGRAAAGGRDHVDRHVHHHGPGHGDRGMGKHQLKLMKYMPMKTMKKLMAMESLAIWIPATRKGTLGKACHHPSPTHLRRRVEPIMTGSIQGMRRLSWRERSTPDTTPSKPGPCPPSTHPPRR